MANLPYGVMAMWCVIAGREGPRAGVARRGSPIPTTVWYCKDLRAGRGRAGEGEQKCGSS
jgi:hypothetical protein